jgi:hypothetical protein
MNSRRIPRRRRALLGPVSLLALALTTSTSCSDAPIPGEQEETLTAPEDVPDEIKEAAKGFCERLGSAWWKEWYWDSEDHCWECSVVGLPRQAELDIETDGSFSELELVYELAEIEAILPDIAELIHTKCRGEPGVFIELSLRRESYLDEIPELEEAWKMSGVVLEFQCPNGMDFEVDSHGHGLTRRVDDTSDPANRR